MSFDYTQADFMFKFKKALGIYGYSACLEPW